MWKATAAFCCAFGLISNRCCVEASRIVASSYITRENAELNTSSNSAGLPGGSVIDPETELMIRACVGERAKDWRNLHKRLGLKAPGDSTYDPVESVREIFHVDDLIAQRTNTRSQVEQWMHWSYFSSNMQKWKEQKEKAAADLLSINFDIEASRKRCAKGMTNQAYQCMLEEACPDNKEDQIWECSSLRKHVRRRIDMKDLVVHLQAQRGWLDSYSKDETFLWNEIEFLTKKISALKFDWTATKLTCRKSMQETADKIKKRTLSELTAGEEIDGSCVEAADKMCPEGTYTTRKRRWDAIKGAAAMGTAYLIAKFTILPLGSAIGTAVGGLAGGTTGLFAANMLVTPISLAAGWWASRGPLECACFPRDCTFSNITNTCQLELHDVTSKNPYSAILPMSGMKCGLAYKSNATCSLQACLGVDYAPDLANGTVFGSVGLQKEAIHNCVSLSGSRHGTLAVVPELPNGKPNTIQGRNAIYDELLESPP